METQQLSRDGRDAGMYVGLPERWTREHFIILITAEGHGDGQKQNNQWSFSWEGAGLVGGSWHLQSPLSWWKIDDTKLAACIS